MKYVKNKETEAVKYIPDYLYGDYINTGDWVESTQSEYEKQQNKEMIFEPKVLVNDEV